MVSLNGARRAQDRKLPNRVYYDSALRLLDKSVLCGRIVGEWAISILQYETGMRLLRVRALPSLHGHRHERSHHSRIQNESNTTSSAGHNTGQSSGRRDEVVSSHSIERSNPPNTGAVTGLSYRISF